MTTCHICGRAMLPVFDKSESVYYPDVVPICERAGCEPERQIHAEMMNDTHERFWPILNRFEVDA